MKLHELEITHDELLDITNSKKNFIVRSDVLNFQVGDLIKFFENKHDGHYIWNVCVSDMYIDEDALYRIICVSKYESGIKDGYCVLGIKKLEVK